MRIVSRVFDWIYEYRFVILLVALITYLFAPNFFSSAQQKNWVLSLVRSLLFISSIGVVWQGSRLRRTVIYSVIGVLVIMTWFNNRLGLNFEIAYLVLAILFFLLIAYEIVLQILENDKVDFQIVASVLCGYLIIGILGLFMFSIIHLRNPEAFSIPVFTFDEMIYFTFITMTTIGYGDILPLTSDSKSASVLLGIAGQFYTTVVIALIVGKFLQDKTNKE
jgi:hypothetical protein